MIEWLSSADISLFSLINSKWGWSALDWPMLLLRNAYTWIPLYAFMLYWSIRYCRKDAWKFALLTLITFAITDYVSASVLKPAFGRLRPCHVSQFQESVRLLLPCGGAFSLPSSHASNHFGIAAFWFFSIRTITGNKWYWLWVWAFAVGYAQVYVGKHYPFDILAGAVFGSIVGIATSFVYRKWTQKTIAAK